MLTVCCAIIEEDGLILLAQRGNGMDQHGKWEFPGGKLEPGETPQQCIVREIMEELGVETVITGTIPSVVHIYPDKTIRLIPFLCRLTKNLPIPKVHKSIAWVLPEDITSYNLSDADVKVLLNYQNRTL